MKTKTSKPRPVNIPAFRKLIKKYESITIEQIKKVWDEDIFNPGDWAARELTGYGTPYTCTLCLATVRVFNLNEGDTVCEACVYGKESACIAGKHKKTYEKIELAKTPEKLLKAFKDRATHLKQSYPQYLKNERTN